MENETRVGGRTSYGVGNPSVLDENYDNDWAGRALHVTWSGRTTVVLDRNGNVVSTKGYPS